MGSGSVTEASSPGEHPQAWLFLRADSVPERWKQRSIAAALIPLSPQEVEEILGQGRTEPLLDPLDERIAQLTAQGVTVNAIARELKISTRSVDRHLARLRAELGVGSTTELAVELARRGF